MNNILLQELNESVQVITEGNGAAKKYYIEGIFLQGDIANRNRRMYRTEILQREVDRYTKNYINQNRAFGELGHPEGATINLDRVSHMFEHLKADGPNYVGRARILSSLPMGRIAAGLLDEGAKLGVSSRGLGSLKVNREGIHEIQDDFILATPGDIVADPSAPDAFVRGIMENRDWSIIHGIWSEEDFEKTQALVRAASKQQLEEISLHVFENFLKRL